VIFVYAKKDETKQGPRANTKLHLALRRLPNLLILLLLVVACEQTESHDGPSRSEATDSSKAMATPRPRRIILISLDTVGSRHVGGYSDASTPNLDKVAADGVRFDRFYAASTYTLPSHMSMLTGLTPIEHGVVNIPARLAPEVPTLASKLRTAGYETKALHEGGFLGKIYGFDQGFEKYELRNNKDVVGVSIWSTLDWMRNKQDAPYFLFLHTYVAHVPYRGFSDFRRSHAELDLPDDAEIEKLKAQYNKTDHESFFPASREIPAEIRHMCTFYNTLASSTVDFLGCGDRLLKDDFLESPHFETYREGLVEAHRAEIRRGDRMVGQVRDLLIELGQWEDTLLVVTSDHGDAMFEHSTHGHDYSPFDEVLKVPLFLSYPRRVAGGQIVRGLTWHLDLFPTILALAGVPTSSDLQGEDLTSVIANGKEISADRAIHPVLLRPTNRYPLPMRRIVLQGEYKFIEGHGVYGDPEGLLFNLADSPDEDVNLRQSQPQVFANLRALSQRFDEGLTPGEPIHQSTQEQISPFPGEVEPYDAPEEIRRGLEALGYLFDRDTTPAEP